MTSRRHVLALLAATPLAPSLTACAPRGLPDPIAAWRAPGAGETDPRRHALAHAILAPNPHNRQPWLVELIGEDELVFYADLERLLPATDPFDRQIVLGCGAFIELLDLAARSNGRRAEIALWPEGEPSPRLDARPVAHIKLVAGNISRDPLFDHILARRTNRRPYEQRAVPRSVFQTLAEAAGSDVTFGSADSGALLSSLRELAWEAFDKEMHTPVRYQETVDLMRIGRTEIARHRDGLAMEGAMIEFARAVGMLNHEIMSDPDNSFVKQGIEALRPLALDAPAFVWITSPDNTRTTQINAGRAYARMNLAATGEGVAMHPWSQALQEYPEMAERYAEARRLLGAPETGCLQMLARVGYGPDVRAAARRGLEEHVLRDGAARLDQQ